MTQASNKKPLAEHARVVGVVVAKLKLEALARMLWMTPALAATSLLVAVEGEAHILHSPFFVAAVEVEAASRCVLCCNSRLQEGEPLCPKGSAADAVSLSTSIELQ